MAARNKGSLAPQAARNRPIAPPAPPPALALVLVVQYQPNISSIVSGIYIPSRRDDASTPLSYWTQRIFPTTLLASIPHYSCKWFSPRRKRGAVPKATGNNGEDNELLLLWLRHGHATVERVYRFLAFFCFLNGRFPPPTFAGKRRLLLQELLFGKIIAIVLYTTLCFLLLLTLLIKNGYYWLLLVITTAH